MTRVSLAGWVTSVVGWLKAGYPNGVPEADYIPLLAVLTRRLSSDEVLAVATQLVRDGQLPVDDIDIGTMITKVSDEQCDDLTELLTPPREAAGDFEV